MFLYDDNGDEINGITEVVANFLFENIIFTTKYIFKKI